MSEQDYAPFMREALALAQEGRFTACPNPTVGAVLVRDGRIVAGGFHRAAGDDHAEVACLKNAAEGSRETVGATLVVTLEPCKHCGKTPPCTDAILAAGIARGVGGLADPNPLAGGGSVRLREAGVEVIEGVLEQECRDLVADFLVWQETDRPYVILKMAATLDGRIAARNGQSRWIGSAASRRKVQQWRAGVGHCGGVVLVGGGTFRADNPRLTARDASVAGPQPLACVVTSCLPRADDAAFLPAERPLQTIFFTSPAAAGSVEAERLRRRGVRVLDYGYGPHDGADFAALMRTLRQETGSPYVLCEGGGRLALSLLEADMADEFRLHLAPSILGDNEAFPLFTGRAPLGMDEALRMRVSETSLCGGDVHLVLRPVV